MSRRGRTIAAAVLAAAMAGGQLVSCGGPAAEDTARSFLKRWQEGRGRAAGELTTAKPAAVADQFDRAFAELGAGRPRLRLDSVQEDDGKATVTFRATLRLGPLDVNWSYRGRFTLREDDGGRWRVAWAPSVVHPALEKGDNLRLNRQFATRAPILAR
ncbi:MAG: hypothetical protein GEV09_27625, partial [Pseudonocardiaceae bacterium]|nr:hypothetical protein [Pseudonocardiaceae bacterium]